MNKYNNGKIYTLTNDDFSDYIYYGSTIQKLSSRLATHKYSSKRDNCSSKILFSKGIVKINLVKNFNCDSKKELHAEERKYIQENNCINKTIPDRTHKEWYQDNKKMVIEKQKKYSENNKEKIKERSILYYEKNKEKIKKKSSEYKAKNKEKIKEKHKIYNAKNKERIAKNAKIWNDNNKEKIKERNKRYQDNLK